MTSEGGGAVAFPVMTLALGIAPSVARDFSLMIQVRTVTVGAGFKATRSEDEFNKSGVKIESGVN